MATTIKVRPQLVTPTYNESILVLDSTNKSEDDFKWIVGVFRAVSPYDLLSSVSILPNPEGFGIVDLHRHVENHISTSFYPLDTDEVITSVSNEGLKWTYEIAEEYTDSSDVFQSVAQTITNNLVHSFNGVLSFQDFRNWDYTEYFTSRLTLPTTKYLTNIPRSYDVTLSDRVWINGLQSSLTDAPEYATIETDNGVFGPTNNKDSIDNNFIVQHKIGPKDLLETTDSTVYAISGSLPVIDANTTFIKYTQQALPLGGVQVSETITLNIVDDCSKHDKIRFFFMDKLGSYVPITFNKVSKSNVTSNRSNYKQNHGNYDDVSEAYGYTTYSRGNTTYDLTTNEKVTCTSDWLNSGTADMVIEMLGSPNVYVQNEIGEYLAINITTDSYEIKKAVNDKLINYTVTFEYANSNSSQRG